MALRRSSLTLVFINVILFFALCAKPISSQGNEDVNGVQKLSVAQNYKEKNPTPSVPKLTAEKTIEEYKQDVANFAIHQIEKVSKYLVDEGWFESQKTCPYFSDEQKKCLDQCQVDIDHAVECGKVTIESVNKKDYPKAIGDVSGMAMEMQKCMDCFTVAQNGENKDVKNVNDYVKQTTSQCIECFTALEEAGVQKLSVDKNYKERVPPPSVPKLAAQKPLGEEDPKEYRLKYAQSLLEQMIAHFVGFKAWFQAEIRCPYVPEEEKKCCESCQVNMDHAADCGKAAIESINKQDLPKAISDVTAIPPEVQKCNDCYTVAKNGEEWSVNGLNNYAKDWSANVLNSLNQASSLSVGQNDDATKKAIEQLEGIKQDL